MASTLELYRRIGNRETASQKWNGLSNEERFGCFDTPSKEEIWEAYKHDGMDDEWTKRMVEEEAYFIERVSIV